MKKHFNFKSMYRTALVALCLMTVGVGKMWGDGQIAFCDYSELSDCVYFKYVKDGGDPTRQVVTSDGQSDIKIGSVSSLVITEFRGITKKHDATICGVYMVYGINTTKNSTYNQSVKAEHNTDGYSDWPWNDYWGCEQYKNSSVNIDLLNEREPGDYWFDFYFSITGDVKNNNACNSNQAYWSNNSGNYHLGYTIPSKNLTVGRANTNGSVSGSQEGVKKGHAYTITATPNDHYAFVGWSTSNTHITIADPTSATTTVTFDDLSDDASVTANFALQWNIKGSISGDEWKPLEFVESNTYRATMNLDAHKTYEFKVYNRRSTAAYGLDNNVWTSSVSDYTMYDGQYQIRLCTAGEGAYTFTWNSSSNQLSVAYPTVTHPNVDYCYLIDYTGSTWTGGAHIHVWNSAASVAGTDPYPGTQLHNKVDIKGTNYFYFAPGDYGKVKLSSNGDKDNHTGDQTPVLSQRLYWNGSAWTWEAFEVHIALDDRDATTNVNPTYFDVDYNSTVLTNLTSIPLKDNYDFQGFYTNSDGTGTQVIDKDGYWIESVADYTDASKHWIHPGCTTTVYAKWTETPRTITLQVSPEGAGSFTVGETSKEHGDKITSYIETATPTITATPSHAAWKFKKWQYSTGVGNKSETGLDNTVQITSDRDGTLTAVFEPRFTLVGSKSADGNPAGGMPGWTDENNDAKAFTVVSTSPSVELIKECNLEANTLYKFQIHDRIDGNFGDGDDGQYNLIETNTAHCYNPDKDMLFTTTGAGKYIFKITAIDGSNRASVQLLWPHQVNFGRRTVDIDGGAHDDDTGGTLVVKAADTTITSGTWHTYNTNVAYDADNKAGYQLTWYNSSSYTETFTAGGEWDHNLTGNDNSYAQFSELATKVSLENDGHGHVEIGGATRTDTTCGVTTTRSLTAVPNTGYSFSSWTKPSGADIDFNTAINPTTLRALGGGLQEGQRVYANFTAKTYSIKLNNDHSGESSEDGTATATYDATSLSVSDHADFTGWTLLGYWNSSAVQVANADGSLIANVDGYTGAGGKWTNDAGGTVNLYAHWSRSVTLDDNGDYDGTGSVTVTYKGAAGTPSAPTRTGYHVEGYYDNGSYTNKVMDANGTLNNVTGYVTDGKWTKTDATTLYAKWEANTYTVTLHNDHDGESSEDGTATATYDDASLSSITHAKFTGWELLGYWNSSAVQVAEANGTLKESVTDFTDGSGKWTKNDNAELWAHWSRSITLDDNVAQQHNGSVTVTYKGSSASHTAPKAREGYTLDGYYNDAAGTTKVMNADGTLVTSVSGYTDASNNWIHKTAATLYAKWTSDHFIIYRTGDKNDDPRKLDSDVESYTGDGSTAIEEGGVVEYRMKVGALDKWYSLCIPFDVDSVGVWDETAGVYYDLVPYYRENPNEDLQGGHYIIRTPNFSSGSSIAIANFDDWRDPTSPTGFLPAKGTPYIILWHMSYFNGKYVSFFGHDVTVPTTMTVSSAPSDDEVVNVYGNDAMVSGSVQGAYVLDSDYGDGAWLRGAKATDNTTVLPFECYIRASSTTTGKVMVLRRGMTIEDEPTGWDDVLNSEKKMKITVYTISGFLVAQYTNCSFAEVAKHLNTDQNSGIFILCSENESIKLLVGGK